MSADVRTDVRTDVRADVCVVGAGPAGMSLALMLLRSGLSVTVVEKASSTERQFRGDILQPGGMQVLDDLGVLAAVRAGGHEHTRFRMMQNGKALLSADYRILPGPRNCLLSVPQPRVLDELARRCGEFAGFTMLSGSRVTDLLRDGDRVTGVRATGRSGALTVGARVVVGADGRYSKVRRLAGLEYTRMDVFDQDVLWFSVPAGGELPTDVTVSRSGGSQVLTYGSASGNVQIGWLLPHGGYREVVTQDLDDVRARICAAAPAWAPQIRERITKVSDLTLLDVFGGVAQTWAADGLVLLGDSAHTHGPIGAQGINLALQDAAVLHPLLVAALADGDVGAARLAAFEAERRPVAERVLRTQRMQSAALLSTNPMITRVRPVVARMMARTPVFRRVLTRIAYCGRPVRVRTDLFDLFDQQQEESACA